MEGEEIKTQRAYYSFKNFKYKGPGLDSNLRESWQFLLLILFLWSFLGERDLNKAPERKS